MKVKILQDCMDGRNLLKKNKEYDISESYAKTLINFGWAESLDEPQSDLEELIEDIVEEKLEEQKPKKSKKK